MDSIIDVKEATDEYFKLKNKYESQIMTNKKKIMNNPSLSNREKRNEYNKLKHKCIHCKRPGGTIFSNISQIENDESFRELRAFCGIIADPCNLNIVIRLAKVEWMPDLLKIMEKDIKDYKNEIIDHKNKLLFGFLNTEDALERFENVKEYISNYTSLYEQYLESYHKIVDNSEKKQKLDETITNSYIEIQKIKDCIIKMNDTNNIQYAKDAVNIYTSTLLPLLQTIRDLKYNETIVWHNDYTNTCNLIQNKYSIANLCFSSSNDKVIAYDVSYSIESKKKNITEQLPLELDNLNNIDNISLGGIPQPIYGDNIDGIKWNVTEYDKLWVNLPIALKTALITDHEWMQDFMSNCVAARASGKPCTFTQPKNLILPPQIDQEGRYNFGYSIYNEAFDTLPEEEKKMYLKFYNEKDGIRNYNMLINAMNDLVAKMVNFNRGYF
jgi:hypothetical protein